MNVPSILPTLMVVGLMLLSGCRQDASVDPGTTIDPATLDFKRTENTVHANILAEPRSLNPLLTTQGYDRYIHEQILQTLNGFHPETFDPVPVLADLPTVTPRTDGGTDYTFEIREEATWPNGTPVTADDLVFTLKALFNPLVEADPYRPYFSSIKNVVTSPGNAKRVRIETNETYILAEAALASLPVYPAYAYDPDGLMQEIRLSDLLNPNTAQQLADNNTTVQQFAEAFNTNFSGRAPEAVVGSGPYQIVSWESGQQIRLEKRDNYWAEGSDEPWLKAGPDALVFNFISDENTIANAIRDQDLDVVSEIPTAAFLKLRQEEETGKFYDFQTTPGFVYYSLLLNTSNPKIEDKETRRALAHLVDVDFIINSFYDSVATRVTGPILPQKSYYNDELPAIDYSPERATTLLEEAGWTDSDGDGTLDREVDGERQDLELNFLSFPTETSQNMATLMQSSAAEVGVKINVEILEPRTLVGRLASGEYDIATMGAGSEPGLDDLTQVWSTKSIPPAGTNRTRFGNAESDRLISQIRTELDQTKRDQLYKEIQEIIYDEQPMIFLFSPLQRIGLTKRFGAEVTSLSPGYKANTFQQEAWNTKKE